jgi:hypothetical protein
MRRQFPGDRMPVALVLVRVGPPVFAWTTAAGGKSGAMEDCPANNNSGEESLGMSSPELSMPAQE